MRLTFLPLLALLACGQSPPIDPVFMAQNGKDHYVATVAFWNVENLFDLEDDPKTDDNDYLPDGPYKWTKERYQLKLDHLAQVLEKLGDEDGPEILGLCEVENKTVLEDLASHEKLKPRGYQMVHFDSPYHRGVDCALLYKPDYFTVIDAKSVTQTIPDNPGYTTRDILVVTGKLLDDTVTFLVNHWPSRRGGSRSVKYRWMAAELAKSIIDSIRTDDPDAKIIVMGDFNDDPTDKSITKGLNATSRVEEPSQLYNPMHALFQAGGGSLAYGDAWNLFDQILVTQAVQKNPNNQFFYRENSAGIFRAEYLFQQEGRFKGYPFRTYVGPNYHGGYSDHLPVYITLLNEPKTNAGE